ncbi:diacylglycerol kinase family protein [Azotobacter chroococcum]
MLETRATPARVGILLNPGSGRVRRRLPALRRIAAALPEALLQEVSGPREIEQALRLWQAGPQDLLVILGGDGTLQATLTALLQEPAGDLPGLLVVPGEPPT